MPHHLRCRKAQMPAESESAVSLHFLAEGAANVVFRVRPFDPNKHSSKRAVVMLDISSFETDMPMEEVHSMAPHLHPTNDLLGQVLRISKGHEKTPHGSQVKTDFEDKIKPLFQEKDEHGTFEEYLLEVTTVELDDDVLPYLNEQIWKHSKREKRDLPIGSVALLMHDMSSQPGRSLTVEIKPKWLAQSMDAPRDAYRCRTCALHAQRERSKSLDPKLLAADLLYPPRREEYICPFELRDGNAKLIKPHLLEQVSKVGAQDKDMTEDLCGEILEAMTEYLCSSRGNRLFRHLATLQTRHDPKGILALRRDRDHPDLQIAMTLRDCSLFVRATYNHGPLNRAASSPAADTIKIEAKLADLDFKHEAKFSDWLNKEELLLNGGWYIYQQGSPDVKGSQEHCKLAKEFRRNVPWMW